MTIRRYIADDAPQIARLFQRSVLELNGHIDHVYALPEAAGTGVVSLLYDDVEKQARHLGIEKLPRVS